MIYIIRSIVVIFVEAIGYGIFLDAFLDRRSEKKGVRFVLWLGFLITVYATACIGIQWIRSGLAIIVTWIFAMFLYKGKWWQVLGCTTLVYSINVMLDVMVLLLLQCILKEDSRGVFRGIYTYTPLIGKVLYLVGMIVINRMFRQYAGMELTKGKNWFGFFVFPITTIVLTLYIYTQQNTDAFVLGVLGLLFENILFVGILQNIVKKEKQLRAMEKQEIQEKNQLVFYQQLEQNYREKQRRVHDFRNHLLCIQGLLEEGQIANTEQYIKQVLEEEEKE